MQAEEGTGRLIRQPPRRLRGSDSAAAELAELIDTDAERTYERLRAFLLRGSELRRSESSRFPIFAFRLHQFLTRGDTVWAFKLGGTLPQQPAPPEPPTIQPAPVRR